MTSQSEDRLERPTHQGLLPDLHRIAVPHRGIYVSDNALT